MPELIMIDVFLIRTPIR